jgi:protein disulfide-isomerase A1
MINTVFGEQNDILFLFRKEEDNDSAFQKVYEEAAKTFKGQILFSYSGSAFDIQAKLAEFMDITEESYPSIRLLLPASGKKFTYDGDVKAVTVEEIGKFVTAVKDGSLKPKYKSAAAPETQENVVVVVGTEFEKLVQDPTKDVLVKFYAPWCGHCKALAPIWEELGEAYKDNANIVIAKFDATENEAEGVNIEGYPTLKWYPKGNKEGETYEGDRELADFKKFIDENAAKDSTKHEEL